MKTHLVLASKVFKLVITIKCGTLIPDFKGECVENCMAFQFRIQISTIQGKCGNLISVLKLSAYLLDVLHNQQIIDNKTITHLHLKDPALPSSSLKDIA